MFVVKLTHLTPDWFTEDSDFCDINVVSEVTLFKDEDKIRCLAFAEQLAMAYGSYETGDHIECEPYGDMAYHDSYVIDIIEEEPSD